mmetsp:Transcript_27332/g.58474  ORF Transcript_27332/g.58474 Transcript_27332/m.58474 type:complete len:255 (+) Transcript_27332:1288-2052(+)
MIHFVQNNIHASSTMSNLMSVSCCSHTDNFRRGKRVCRIQLTKISCSLVVHTAADGIDLLSSIGKKFRFLSLQSVGILRLGSAVTARVRIIGLILPRIAATALRFSGHGSLYALPFLQDPNGFSQTKFFVSVVIDPLQAHAHVAGKTQEYFHVLIGETTRTVSGVFLVQGFQDGNHTASPVQYRDDHAVAKLVLVDVLGTTGGVDAQGIKIGFVHEAARYVPGRPRQHGARDDSFPYGDETGRGRVVLWRCSGR